jgi:hypothetical protein
MRSPSTSSSLAFVSSPFSLLRKVIIGDAGREAGCGKRRKICRGYEERWMGSYGRLKVCGGEAKGWN